MASDAPETEPLLQNQDEDDAVGTTKHLPQWDDTWFLVKIVLGAGMGSMMEFYSFGLVAYFTTQLENAYFPPTDSEFESLLEEFTLFGLAFLMRPVGALIFGYIGDKFGRVTCLRLSLFTMVVPTVLFGCIPNYSVIGYGATVIVFILRALQGISVGGETSTALVYIYEEAPARMKATLLGYVYAMSCGSYFALIVYDLYYASEGWLSSDVTDWSWRLAFVSAFFVGIFGLYLRFLLPVSHEFEEMEAEGTIEDNPLKEVFTTYYVEFFVLFLVYIAPALVYYSNVVWIPIYLDSSVASFDDNVAYDMQLVSSGLSIIFYAVSGVLADAVGLYRFFKYSTSLLLATILVAYLVIGVSSNVYVVSIFQILLSGCALGTPAFLYWALFWCPVPSIRNSLMAITYNLGMAIFVSTQFDVETYLADLDANWGCFFAGLYILIIVGLSVGAVYWAEHCHSWEQYLDAAGAEDEDAGDRPAVAAVEESKEDEEVSLAPAI